MTAEQTQGPTLVELRDVESEIGRQMQERSGRDAEPRSIVRMSNLVIFCDDVQRAARIASEVPDIVARHPARVLLLVGHADAADAVIEASVLVRDHGNRAVSEQVTLRASGSRINRLPFAVRNLQVGDLPTNLWWASREPPALTGTLLYELAEFAQQVIYDSVGWPDPTRAVAATAPWIEQFERRDGAGRWRVVSDLNWRRLKHWRRLVSQALDPGSAPGAATSIREIVVEHGPHAVVQGFQLVGWMTGRLGWQLQRGSLDPGSEIVWELVTPNGTARARVCRLVEGEAEVRCVRISCEIDAEPTTLCLVNDGPGRLTIKRDTPDCAPRSMLVPSMATHELVGRQLSDRERDTVFAESMTAARLLARSLSG